MTAQEAYEQVRAFFSQPNAQIAKIRGVDVAPHCVYRGDNDPHSPIRCAVGCLLPDDQYSPWMEGVSVTSFRSTTFTYRADPGTDDPHPTFGACVTPQFFRSLPPETLSFLGMIQEIHDSDAETPHHFVRLLDALAEDLDELEVVGE